MKIQNIVGRVGDLYLFSSSFFTNNMNPLRQAQENNFQKSNNVELHSEPGFQKRKSVSDSPIEAMPKGPNRIAALEDLGATFEEGNHEVTKIATPIEDISVPSFVDTDQVRVSKNRSSLNGYNEIHPLTIIRLAASFSGIKIQRF